ncbi:hypothetical protein CXR23_07035 [Brevibacterium aurantiacum]|uniref:Uncharacterized protein n=1 Tax=Brevibacterium aurantiacum TaxID=273384 RepID=A0A3T0DD23_BREAU|nr:hypothetical protein CXR23_07035 [Brevibacterium aurantiacum]
MVNEALIPPNSQGRIHPTETHEIYDSTSIKCGFESHWGDIFLPATLFTPAQNLIIRRRQAQEIHHHGRDPADSASSAEVFVYPGDQHLFTDSSLDSFDAVTSALLLKRARGFLAAIRASHARNVGTRGGSHPAARPGKMVT